MFGARSFLLASIAWVACASVLVASEEQLERAKELYRAAAFTEALSLLDELAKDPAGHSSEAFEYRLFCLIALERTTEARLAAESMVQADPFHQLSSDRASPRVRALFADVRQSVLPAIVRQTYEDAKKAFDRRESGATAGFERVLKLLDDPALLDAPAFADLRTAVTAFRDVSKAAAAPAVPTVVALPLVPLTGSDNLPEPPPALYRGGEPGVVAPVAVSQTPPRWVTPVGLPIRPFQGSIQIVIDERGTVETAEIVEPIHPLYDPQLLQAAASWTYRPASRNGVPVRFLKVVNVRLEGGPN